MAGKGKVIDTAEPRGPRRPRSRYYDGALYARFVDRLLERLHGRVSALIPDGAGVLDAGSGTGAMAVRLAPRCARVVGVELSPKMLQYALHRRDRLGLKNLEFHIGDAAHLTQFAAGEFDFALLTLALHEMPAAARVPVLCELGRVARGVLVTDWAVPMPRNRQGLRNRALELLAGPEHFASFREFTRLGGARGLCAAAGLDIRSEQVADGGTIVITHAALRGAVA